MINSYFLVILDIIWVINNIISIIYYTNYSQLLFLIIGNIIFLSIINYYYYKKTSFDKYAFVTYCIIFYFAISCVYMMLVDFNKNSIIYYSHIIIIFLPIITFIIEFINIFISSNKLSRVNSYIIEPDNNI